MCAVCTHYFNRTLNTWTFTYYFNKAEPNSELYWKATRRNFKLNPACDLGKTAVTPAHLNRITHRNWGTEELRNWGLRNWGLRNWGLRNWGLRNWGTEDWGTEELRNWGLRNWGLRNWGLRTEDWGTEDWGTEELRNWGLRNWGLRNWGQSAFTF